MTTQMLFILMSMFSTLCNEAVKIPRSAGAHAERTRSIWPGEKVLRDAMKKFFAGQLYPACQKNMTAKAKNKHANAGDWLR